MYLALSSLPDSLRHLLQSTVNPLSEVTCFALLKFQWTLCPLIDFLSDADWFASSPVRELRMGSSRSVVAPMDLLVSPPSIPGHVDQRSESVTCAVAVRNVSV